MPIIKYLKIRISNPKSELRGFKIKKKQFLLKTELRTFYYLRFEKLQVWFLVAFWYDFQLPTDYYVYFFSLIIF